LPQGKGGDDGQAAFDVLQSDIGGGTKAPGRFEPFRKQESTLLPESKESSARSMKPGQIAISIRRCEGRAWLCTDIGAL